MHASKQRRAIRLAFSALFWRLLIGFTLLFEAVVGMALIKRVPPGQWLIAFLFFSPPFLGLAFTVASSLTLVANVVVELIIRPRLLSWLAPRVDESNALFHLEPRESISAESTARMAAGRSWVAGRLVQTDRRLLFLPCFWDAEPWVVRHQRITSHRTVAAPNLFWGLVRDLPPYLEVVVNGEESRRFALLDARQWSIATLGRTPSQPLSSRS